MAGVWLRAVEVDMNAAQWATWLVKDFTYTDWSVCIGVIVSRVRQHCTLHVGMDLLV